jgi:alkaline phosphatase
MPTPTAAPIVIYAAGDIASCQGSAPGQNNGAMITSDMLLKTSGPIFTLGDNSNEAGTKSNYAKCYKPTWGRLLDRTYPVMGNHDRGNDIQGSAYFAYFAGRTGDWGHYSLDLGAWHIVVLNAQCGIGEQNCRTGSPQEVWLKADLAATRQKCIMALWHQPLFTSGNEAPFKTARSFWTDLYKYKADVILNGHNHIYERYFPQDPNGRVDANGLREFVVGTGGSSLEPPVLPPDVNEMVRDSSTYGYLKLTLSEDSYAWQFVAQPGQGFTDSGSANCHR